MANIRITDLVTLTEPVSTDVLPIVDVSLDVTKKISIAEILRTAVLGSQTDPGISFDGDADTGVYSPGANQLAFTTNGAEALRIDSDGLIGIGTTDPIARLNVKGISGTYPTQNIQHSALDVEGEFLRISRTTSVVRYHSMVARQSATTTTGNNYIQFKIHDPSGGQTAQNTALHLDGTGNVGIGTTNPEAKLSIVGTNTNGGIKIVDSSTSASSPGIEVIAKRGDINDSTSFSGKLLLARNRTEAAIVEDNQLGSVSFGGNHTDGTEANILYSAALIGVADGDFNDASDMPTALAFYTGSTGWSPDTANASPGTERLRITSDGRVGIGTSDPGRELEVNGAIESSGTIYGVTFAGTNDTNSFIRFPGSDVIEFYNGNTESARIDSSGRLLVGTSTSTNVVGDASVLQVAHVGGLSASLSRYFSTAAAGPLLSFARSRGALNVQVAVQNNDNLGRIYFTGSNGTDFSNIAAEIKSEVDGDPFTSGDATDLPGRLVFSTTANGASSPTTRMTIDSDGNVGIGTTNPSTLLDINQVPNTFTLNTNTIDYTLFLQGGGTSATEGDYGASIGFSRNNGGERTGAVIATKQTSSDADQQGIAFLTHESSSTNSNLVEQMLITHDGNVGIGTTDPGSNLEVKSNAFSAITINTDRTSGNLGGISIASQGTQVSQIYGTAGGDLVLLTDEAYTFCGSSIGDERARIDSGGRLLVGTSTSQDVAGNFGATSAANIQVVASSTFAAYSAISRKNDASGPLLALASSRSNSIVQQNDRLGEIRFAGYDGTDYNTIGAYIRAEVDGTPGVDDMPGRLVLATTGDGASSPTERVRIAQGGELLAYSVFTVTTAQAADVNIASNGTLRRSTSSSKYKADIEPIEDSYSDALLSIRPVWYRSTCEADSKHHSYWGFIAEEVAAIDPRLVHWKTVEIEYDENGSAVEVPCDPEPEGVAYDRFVPHLLKLIKQQKEQIETLEQRLTDAGIA